MKFSDKILAISVFEGWANFGRSRENNGLILRKYGGIRGRYGGDTALIT